jgi:hypothetical protein
MDRPRQRQPAGSRPTESDAEAAAPDALWQNQPTPRDAPDAALHSVAEAAPGVMASTGMVEKNHPSHGMHACTRWLDQAPSGERGSGSRAGRLTEQLERAAPGRAWEVARLGTARPALRGTARRPRARRGGRPRVRHERETANATLADRALLREGPDPHQGCGARGLDKFLRLRPPVLRCGASSRTQPLSSLLARPCACAR